MPDLKDFELKPCHKGGRGEGNAKEGGLYMVLQPGCSFRVLGQARELGHVVPHRNRCLFRKYIQDTYCTQAHSHQHEVKTKSVSESSVDVHTNPKLLNPTNFSGLNVNLGCSRDVGEKPGFFRKIMGLEEKPGFFPVLLKIRPMRPRDLA